MNKDFPRIITLLRKERGLSQKQVSNDLDISQALLSHYEKGIRECGLDFVAKVADYYGVSCDYLLGRTPQRNGATLNVQDIPEYIETQADADKVNMLALLNKKLLINSTAIIMDTTAKSSDKKLISSVSEYMMCCNYRIFRKLYSADSINPQALFSLQKDVYNGFSKAMMEIQETKINKALRSKKIVLKTSPDIITTDYPKEASSLFNLIQHSELLIKQGLL